MGPQTASPQTKAARILIVDDQEQNLSLLRRILARAGYENVASTSTPAEVLSLKEKFQPDLVLLDLHMGDMTASSAPGAGHQPARRRPSTILMITADDSAEVTRRACARCQGFRPQPFDSAEVLLVSANLLETRFLYQTLQDQNSELEQKVAERTEGRSRITPRGAGAPGGGVGSATTTRAITQIALRGVREARAGHRAPDGTVELIRRAAPLHDIGKVAIPDNILLKAGPLTAPEFATMKTHTVIGSVMLADGRSELVRVSQRIARSHHEWWDGSGYPDKTSREAIPLEARIVAIADFLDALTHDRPYRRRESPRHPGGDRGEGRNPFRPEDCGRAGGDRLEREPDSGSVGQPAASFLPFPLRKP